MSKDLLPSAVDAASKDLLPSAVDAASKYLTHPPTPGETVGSVIGAPFGPLGAFIGGSIGRMIKSRWFD